MPELPEIETICRGLATAMQTKVITNIIIRTHQLRYPIHSTVKTTAIGQTIVKLTRRGKYLLFYLNDSGGLLLHLGMSGSLRLVNDKTALKKHDHIDICLKEHCLRFNDPRRFGMIAAVEKFATHPLLSHLGLEPLNRHFSARYLYQKIAMMKVPIKQAIMNHKIVVGIGNIYANEALFRANIYPLCQAKQLNRIQCQALISAIKKTLQTAIKAGGTTLKDFVDGHGKPGYFQQQLAVYNRAKQPCRRCLQPIMMVRIGNRSTFYCPTCQKA